MNGGYTRLDGFLGEETLAALQAAPGDAVVPDDGWHARLLPRFDGERVDLPLNRSAPF